MEGRINKGKLLVKEPIEKEEIVNGVVIPPTLKIQRTAEVIIGGEQVEAGKTVTFNAKKARATKVHIEDNDYLLLNEQDVLYFE